MRKDYRNLTKKTKGVKRVNVSFELESLEVEWNPSEISEEEIMRKIGELGYFVEKRKDDYEKIFPFLSGASSILMLATMFFEIPYNCDYFFLFLRSYSGLLKRETFRRPFNFPLLCL